MLFATTEKPAAEGDILALHRHQRNPGQRCKAISTAAAVTNSCQSLRNPAEDFLLLIFGGKGGPFPPEKRLRGSIFGQGSLTRASPNSGGAVVRSHHGKQQAQKNTLRKNPEGVIHCSFKLSSYDSSTGKSPGAAALDLSQKVRKKNTATEAAKMAGISQNSFAPASQPAWVVGSSSMRSPHQPRM